MGITNLEYEPAKKGPSWLAAILVAIVVVVISAVLGAIILPIIASAHQAAKFGAADNDVRDVGFATLRYLDEHHNTYPRFSNGQEMAIALRPYISDPRLKTEAAIFVWNQKLSGVTVNHLNKPTQEWVFYFKQPYGLPRDFVGYTDGHFRSFAETGIAWALEESDQGQFDHALANSR